MAAAIRECGYRDSTVADVVRHARTSRRTFYEHFPGKQACFLALLREANAAMVRQIAAAVDRRAPWDVQARQAIEAWIAAAQADLALTLSWIRDLPSLGADARHLQREWLEAFIVLVRELTDTPELRAAGVAPPSRQLMSCCSAACASWSPPPSRTAPTSAASPRWPSGPPRHCSTQPAAPPTRDCPARPPRGRGRDRWCSCVPGIFL